MQNVSWSASTTCAETVRNARRLGLAVCADGLPYLHDIDTLEVADGMNVSVLPLCCLCQSHSLRSACPHPLCNPIVIVLTDARW